MNTKQMILIEYLVDTFIKTANKEQKRKLVFEIEGQLYTGEFLQKIGHNSDERKSYVDRFDSNGANPTSHIKETNYFSLKPTNMEQELRKDFINSVKQKEILKKPLRTEALFLESAIRFVSTIDPDEYLAKDLDFPPVIYNLHDLETDKQCDYYLTGEKTIEIVFLAPAKYFGMKLINNPQ